MGKNMKRELAITGIALVVSILLSSPSLAQTSQPANAAPTPAPVATNAEPEPILSLDEIVQGEFAPEDRARMLMRCIGPPPKPFPAQQVAAPSANEPALLAAAD
jgi:hypothetical protein